MSKRLATMKMIIEKLSMFDGYNDSVKEIENMLNALSDKDFHQYMLSLQSGDEVLPYIKENLAKTKISVERNLKIAEKLGHQFFQRLWLTDKETGDVYLTPIRYLVMDMPLRRQQQHLMKKISIPESNSHIDDLTGQVTGPSKGSRLSYPEMQILYSQGLRHSITEMFTFRGGNIKANAALERDALTHDFPSMAASYDPNTKVRSNEVLSIFLNSAHLSNNLIKKQPSKIT